MLSARKVLVLLCILLSTYHAQAREAAGRRVLHVSLYPYIPQAPAAALALKQGFEDLHPDVIVKITFNPRYYSTNPADKGVLYEDADLHEIDSIFLRDFIDRHALAKLPKTLSERISSLEPIAAEAAGGYGRLVAVPHWMCGDFLIYRNNKPALSRARSLGDIERALGDHSLLIDMKGDALGELYLSALLARNGPSSAAPLQGASTPEPAILARLRRILALEPPGFGRNAAYGAREGFYARQLARRAGSAFLGYSEMIHEVLDETAISCRTEEHCVTADQLGVAAFPWQDGTVRPAVWVDMFGIDARAHGQVAADAAAFIRYAVSLPAYRLLLIPTEGESPRYLLPTTQAAFDDPQIVHAAPLLPQFRAILDRGAVASGPQLNAVLHDVANKIDADLPVGH